jgi:hypothetical protein
VRACVCVCMCVCVLICGAQRDESCALLILLLGAQMGPVLVKQDVAEAKANVGKRVEMIRSELCVCGCASSFVWSHNQRARVCAGGGVMRSS